MKTKIKLALWIIILFVMHVNFSYAEGVWAIGLATQNLKGQYEDSKTITAPILTYEKGWFSASTLDGVSYRLIGLKPKVNQNWSLSLLLIPRAKPDFGDDKAHDSLNRKHGLDLGLKEVFVMGSIFFEIQAVSDLTNAHAGSEIRHKISYQLQSLPVKISIGAVYRSSSLNQYLFGVEPSEASGDLVEYAAEDSLTGFAGIGLSFPITQKLIGFGEIKYEDMGALSNSPLIVDDKLIHSTLGIVYRW